ncbi:hypothetical protein L6452_36132 [Arctium lappa]|uniref:Uncharacterized protein n=1 Tax=Arctium lappa TaxID=4217 RepID=A0ACB8Y8F2_ARCLA|nr:hypothetical protein L6452_36132 [Arctium lappa]
MSGHGAQHNAIAQMRMELEIARNLINALDEQNRKAAEKIALLRNQSTRNPLGSQNGPRPPFNMPFAGFRPPLPSYPRPSQGVGDATYTIPTLLMSSTTFSTMPIPLVYVLINGEVVESSHRNGFFTTTGVTLQDSGFVPALPSTTNGFNLDDPVARLLKVLEDQNEKMLLLLSKLPGVVVSVDVEPRTGFQASPFVDEIAMFDVPKKYNSPMFTPKYFGVTDPIEHIAHFGATLTGAALQWLINLKPKSINNFSELVNQFFQQFASSRKMEKQTNDLYYITKKTGEFVRSYLNRFNSEMINMLNYDVKTAIEVYK